MYLRSAGLAPVSFVDPRRGHDVSPRNVRVAAAAASPRPVRGNVSARREYRRHAETFAPRLGVGWPNAPAA